MNNKIIIFATLAFILASFVFLSIIESKQSDLNDKNIWMVYFVDPKNNSLDFTIENHSDSSTFHWIVLSDKTKVQESDVAISNGKTKNIPLSIADIQNKKITISVIDENNNKKEIYKSL